MFLQNLEGRGSRGSGGENMLIDDEGGPVTTRFAKRAHSDVPRRLSPQRRMVGGHAAALGNAVPVKLAQVVASSVSEALIESEMKRVSDDLRLAAQGAR